MRLLLAINAVMFVVELGWRLIAESAGFVADSLDMFADAAFYGLALYAVGRVAALKTRAAHIAGWLQLVLALGALSEMVRRVFFGSEPESALIMSVGAVAHIANATCLILIAKKRDRGGAYESKLYIFRQRRYRQSRRDRCWSAGYLDWFALPRSRCGHHHRRHRTHWCAPDPQTKIAENAFAARMADR